MRWGLEHFSSEDTEGDREVGTCLLHLSETDNVARHMLSAYPKTSSKSFCVGWAR